MAESQERYDYYRQFATTHSLNGFLMATIIATQTLAVVVFLVLFLRPKTEVYLAPVTLPEALPVQWSHPLGRTGAVPLTATVPETTP